MTFTNKLIWVVLFTIIFVCTLGRYLTRVPERNYCDFRVYYKAGQDFFQGKNIYVRDRQDVTPFKYSPFFAFLFTPLSFLPIKIAAGVFFTINFLATLLYFWLCFHLARGFLEDFSFSGVQIIFIYFITAVSSVRYIFLDWDSGQVSIIMCVLVLLGLRFLNRQKEPLAAASFVASIFIKYTPAIFLPYFLIKKNFKLIFWAMLFLCVFLIIPAFSVGYQKEILYLKSWIPSIISTSLDEFSYIDGKNQSIYSMVVRFFTNTYFGVNFCSLSFQQAVDLGRVVVMLMYLLIFIPGRFQQKDFYLDAGMLMLGVSLFNPNGWPLNFVSLVFPYILLIQYLLSIKGKDRFVLYCTTVSFIISNLICRDILGKYGEIVGLMFSSTTFAAILLYAALLKLKFWPKAVKWK